ncbi:MAG: hypothetical protein HYY82_12150 [Deltaproteobacteria bacterium]|nr:hypothetical protein [Deltaproteobacteria bacterium]
MADIQIHHRCIPYCKPDQGEHTELVYTDETASEGTIRQSLEYWRGLKVIRAVEEPDAPPPDRVHHDVVQSGSRPLAKAWLVTWR